MMNDAFQRSKMPYKSSAFQRECGGRQQLIVTMNTRFFIPQPSACKRQKVMMANREHTTQ